MSDKATVRKINAVHVPIHLWNRWEEWAAGRGFTVNRQIVTAWLRAFLSIPDSIKPLAFGVKEGEFLEDAIRKMISEIVAEARVSTPGASHTVSECLSQTLAAIKHITPKEERFFLTKVERAYVRAIRRISKAHTASTKVVRGTRRKIVSDSVSGALREGPKQRAADSRSPHGDQKDLLPPGS